MLNFFKKLFERTEKKYLCSCGRELKYVSYPYAGFNGIWLECGCN